MDRFEVARFSTLGEAELAAAFLQRRGLDAQVADREISNSAPHLQIALGGARITVPQIDILDARELVERARRGELAYSDDDLEWRTQAIPGRVGELHEHEIKGVLGRMKQLVRAMMIALLIYVFASWVIWYIWMILVSLTD